MKKIVALLIAVAMLLSVVSVMAEAATDAALSDVFVSYGVEADGTLVDVVPEGMDIKIILYKDGTAKNVNGTKVEPATWELSENGILITDADGQTVELALYGETGALALDLGNGKLILAYVERNVAAEYVTGGVLMADGTLVTENIPEEVNMTMVLYDDGSVDLVASGRYEIATWANADNGISITDSNGMTMTGEYDENGALILPISPDFSMVLVYVPEDAYIN